MSSPLNLYSGKVYTDHYFKIQELRNELKANRPKPQKFKKPSENIRSLKTAFNQNFTAFQSFSPGDRHRSSSSIPASRLRLENLTKEIEFKKQSRACSPNKDLSCNESRYSAEEFQTPKNKLSSKSFVEEMIPSLDISRISKDHDHSTIVNSPQELNETYGILEIEENEKAQMFIIDLTHSTQKFVAYPRRQFNTERLKRMVHTPLIKPVYPPVYLKQVHHFKIPSLDLSFGVISKPDIKPCTNHMGDSLVEFDSTFSSMIKTPLELADTLYLTQAPGPEVIKSIFKEANLAPRSPDSSPSEEEFNSSIDYIDNIRSSLEHTKLNKTYTFVMDSTEYKQLEIITDEDRESLYTSRFSYDCKETEQLPPIQPQFPVYSVSREFEYVPGEYIQNQSDTNITPTLEINLGHAKPFSSYKEPMRTAPTVISDSFGHQYKEPIRTAPTVISDSFGNPYKEPVRTAPTVISDSFGQPFSSYKEPIRTAPKVISDSFGQPFSPYKEPIRTAPTVISDSFGQPFYSYKEPIRTAPTVISDSFGIIQPKVVGYILETGSDSLQSEQTPHESSSEANERLDSFPDFHFDSGSPLITELEGQDENTKSVNIRPAESLEESLEELKSYICSPEERLLTLTDHLLSPDEELSPTFTYNYSDGSETAVGNEMHPSCTLRSTYTERLEGVSIAPFDRIQSEETQRNLEIEADLATDSIFVYDYFNINPQRIEQDFSSCSSSSDRDEILVIDQNELITYQNKSNILEEVKGYLDQLMEDVLHSTEHQNLHLKYQSLYNTLDHNISLDEMHEEIGLSNEQAQLESFSDQTIEEIQISEESAQSDRSSEDRVSYKLSAHSERSSDKSLLSDEERLSRRSSVDKGLSSKSSDDERLSRKSVDKGLSSNSSIQRGISSKSSHEERLSVQRGLSSKSSHEERLSVERGLSSKSSHEESLSSKLDEGSLSSKSNKGSLSSKSDEKLSEKSFEERISIISSTDAKIIKKSSSEERLIEKFSSKSSEDELSSRKSSKLPAEENILGKSSDEKPIQKSFRERIAIISSTMEKLFKSSSDERISEHERISKQSLVENKYSESSLEHERISKQSLVEDKYSESSSEHERISEKSLVENKYSESSSEDERFSKKSLVENKYSESSSEHERISEKSLVEDKYSESSSEDESLSKESLVQNKYSESSSEHERISEKSLVENKYSESSSEDERLSKESLVENEYSESSSEHERISEKSLVEDKYSESSSEDERLSKESLVENKYSESSSEHDKISLNSSDEHKVSGKSLKQERLSVKSLAKHKFSENSLDYERLSEKSLVENKYSKRSSEDRESSQNSSAEEGFLYKSKHSRLSEKLLVEHIYSKRSSEDRRSSHHSSAEEGFSHKSQHSRLSEKSLAEHKYSKRSSDDRQSSQNSSAEEGFSHKSQHSRLSEKSLAEHKYSKRSSENRQSSQNSSAEERFLYKSKHSRLSEKSPEPRFSDKSEFENISIKSDFASVSSKSPEEIYTDKLLYIEQSSHNPFSIDTNSSQKHEISLQLLDLPTIPIQSQTLDLTSDYSKPHYLPVTTCDLLSQGDYPDTKIDSYTSEELISIPKNSSYDSDLQQSALFMNPDNLEISKLNFPSPKYEYFEIEFTQEIPHIHNSQPNIPSFDIPEPLDFPRIDFSAACLDLLDLEDIPQTIEPPLKITPDLNTLTSSAIKIQTFIKGYLSKKVVLTLKKQKNDQITQSKLQELSIRLQISTAKKRICKASEVISK